MAHEPVMFLEFQNPLPVVTPLGDGYAIYVRDGGTFENDVWAVALANGGHIRHFRSDQIKIHHNSTFDIKKSKHENNKQQPNNQPLQHLPQDLWSQD